MSDKQHRCAYCQRFIDPDADAWWDMEQPTNPYSPAAPFCNRECADKHIKKEAPNGPAVQG